MRSAVHTRKVSQQNRPHLSLFRSAQLQRINRGDYMLQLARYEIFAQPTGTIAPAQFKKTA